MNNKLFTKEEVKILSENKYIMNVSVKGITYIDEFKNIFMIENKQCKFPRHIFDECGFDINIAGNRWCTSYNRDGVVSLTDTRKSKSGRPSEKELSINMKYEHLQAQNNLFEAENELLKIQFLEMG